MRASSGAVTPHVRTLPMCACLYRCESGTETDICENIDATLFTTPYHTVYYCYCYCMRLFGILMLATSCTMYNVFLAEHFADLLLMFGWEEKKDK